MKIVITYALAEQFPQDLCGRYPQTQIVTPTRTLSTRAILASAVLALLVAACAAPAAGEARERPNIIIILTDNHGYGDIGIHNEKIRTPHLDQFAREGIELTRFYTSPMCAPSRAGLMTGRHYYHTGVIHTSRGARRCTATR